MGITPPIALAVRRDSSTTISMGVRYIGHEHHPPWSLKTEYGRGARCAASSRLTRIRRSFLGRVADACSALLRRKPRDPAYDPALTELCRDRNSGAGLARRPCVGSVPRRRAWLSKNPNFSSSQVWSAAADQGPCGPRALPANPVVRRPRCAAAACLMAGRRMLSPARQPSRRRCRW
jgi:hypothetical protein